MPSPKPSGCRVIPVFVPMARQVLSLSLWVFMGRKIVITHRAEVNGLVADTDGVLVPARVFLSE